VSDVESTPGRPVRPIRRVSMAAGGLVLVAAVTFGVLAPPEHCPSPTTADLRASATAAVQWFVRNQHPDGTWLYEYDARNDVVADGYNFVRHAGGVMGLYQAATVGIPDALESADRGSAWVRDHLVEHDGWTALASDGRAPVGATALYVAGLVERRDLTGDEADDDLLASLGRFLVAQTEPSGAVTAQYDTTTMSPEVGSRSKYYTGEAYWALTRLHRVFPDEGFGEVADRIGRYLATERDEVEDLWPPIPDHWAAYGLAETAEFPERDPDRPLTDAELAYARRLAGLFGSQVRWISQQAGPWGSVVRGTKVPRGGGYGVGGEALAALWRAAGSDARLEDARAGIGERAECLAGLAIEVQDDGSVGGQPDLADGAWFIDGVTRMDDQQHATSALLGTMAIVDGGPSSGHDEPNRWLWALALLATLNPVFVALALPRRGQPAERAALATLGGLAGSLLVVLVAAASGPVLDLLDVSPAAARVAVGIVGAFAAIVRLARRPPRPQDGLPGLRSALVPVAVPLVAAPALLVLGLGAGADLGTLFVTGCLFLGVALLAGSAAAVPDDGPWATVARWGQRVVSAVAAVACIFLVTSGVLAI
jgi:small neutral amino acid transporter SnatA (MarC family)